MPQVLQTTLALWPLWALLIVLLISGEVLRQLGWIEIRGSKRHRRVFEDSTDDDEDPVLDGGEWRARKHAARVTFPYVSRPSLLTAGERDFFQALERAVAGRSVIFAQVNLASLIEVRTNDKTESQAAYNRICRKHVDFVLCDMQNGSHPILVIELDDKSHELSTRRLRDLFVDRALEAADLPILHVPSAAAYDPNQIEAAIRQALSRPPKPDARIEAEANKAHVKRDLAKLRAQRPR